MSLSKDFSILKPTNMNGMKNNKEYLPDHNLISIVNQDSGRK